ncbi:MAG: hypothetical protein ACR5LD_06440 [Symbiopectobacterium sp.]
MVLSRLLDVDVAQPIDCSAVMNNLRVQNPIIITFPCLCRTAAF